MTTQDKIKASKPLLDAIKGLGNEDQIRVTYGTDYNGQPRGFKIRCTVWKSTGPSYSIYKDEQFSMVGMNLENITKTTMKGYTYDMMGKRTTYTFPLYEMILDTTYDDIKY